jgi:hypothetical protein
MIGIIPLIFHPVDPVNPVYINSCDYSTPPSASPDRSGQVLHLQDHFQGGRVGGGLEGIDGAG